MRKYRAKQEKIRKNNVKVIKFLQNFHIKLEMFKIFLKKSYIVGNFNRLTKLSIFILHILKKSYELAEKY